MQHTLKAGVQWERPATTSLIGAQAPTVAINWNCVTNDPGRSATAGARNLRLLHRLADYTEGKIHSNNVGFFLQDAWTISNRLTLNLGLRSDAETIPSYRPENPSLEFGIGDKIAPRVGFAYDVKGDGQWKAYGSWGLFYDIIEARDAARRVGCRPLDRLSLHARLLQLAVHQL